MPRPRTLSDRARRSSGCGRSSSWRETLRTKRRGELQRHYISPRAPSPPSPFPRAPYTPLVPSFHPLVASRVASEPWRQRDTWSRSCHATHHHSPSTAARPTTPASLAAMRVPAPPRRSQPRPRLPSTLAEATYPPLVPSYHPLVASRVASEPWRQRDTLSRSCHATHHHSPSTAAPPTAPASLAAMRVPAPPRRSQPRPRLTSTLVEAASSRSKPPQPQQFTPPGAQPPTSHADSQDSNPNAPSHSYQPPPATPETAPTQYPPTPPAASHPRTAHGSNNSPASS